MKKIVDNVDYDIYIAEKGNNIIVEVDCRFYNDKEQKIIKTDENRDFAINMLIAAIKRRHV